VTGQPVARYLASGRIAQQHAAHQATCTSGRLCEAVEADVGVLTAVINCSGTGEEQCTDSSSTTSSSTTFPIETYESTNH
jgi:hypothetical protein